MYNHRDFLTTGLQVEFEQVRAGRNGRGKCRQGVLRSKPGKFPMGRDRHAVRITVNCGQTDIARAHSVERITAGARFHGSMRYR